jgi:hypothetical protein
VRYDKPFRHAVIDDYLSADTVRQINAEWPASDWTREDGKGQRKWSRERLTPTALAVARSVDVAMLEDMTGISGLFADPEFYGAGLHCIPPGGFLKMHVDFNLHPKGWHRRVNVLIYLNEVWHDDWLGHLQLGLKKPKCIAPIGGRCVVFETNGASWHGHPEPLACPDGVQRRSLALYYYTAEPPKGEAHSTIYQK